MKRIVGLLIAVVLGAAGCGQPGGTSSAGFGQTAGARAGSPIAASPEAAVFEFLEAVRTANDDRAAALLTPLARKKTAQMDMVVAPPGSPTARFEVGSVEYVTPSKDGAHVQSKWTDVVDPQGHTRTDEIIWVLRLESEGWRIAGMVTSVFPDQPPLVLNFEEPQDMLRKQELLREADEQQAPDDAPAETAPNATMRPGGGTISR